MRTETKEGGGARWKVSFFSPPPSPTSIFFALAPNLRAMTQVEMLAIQAREMYLNTTKGPTS